MAGVAATPLCSSTAKKSSFALPDPRERQLFPPPPPEFLSDHSIRLHSSAPRDGLVDQQCSSVSRDGEKRRTD